MLFLMCVYAGQRSGVSSYHTSTMSAEFQRLTVASKSLKCQSPWQQNTTEHTGLSYQGPRKSYPGTRMQTPSSCFLLCFWLCLPQGPICWNSDKVGGLSFRMPTYNWQLDRAWSCQTSACLLMQNQTDESKAEWEIACEVRHSESDAGGQTPLKPK